jgi:hypothetical protein
MTCSVRARNSACPNPVGGSISIDGAVPGPDEVGWPVVSGVEEVGSDEEAVVSEEVGSGADVLVVGSGADVSVVGSGADVSVVGSAWELALGSGCSRRTGAGRSCLPPDPAPCEISALNRALASLSATGESTWMAVKWALSSGSGAGRRARMAPIAAARAPRARIVAVARFYQRRTERPAAGSRIPLLAAGGNQCNRLGGEITMGLFARVLRGRRS